MSELERPVGMIDVLKLPLLGNLLRWRYGRLVFQIPFFAIALLLIYDGFTGSQIASQNLATIAPWVHYRGLVIVALLLAGNLFCMGCPFTIPRTLAKRLSRRGPRFPRILRNKGLAIAGLFILFFLYEWLDLWASPALTAWVIIFYFAASFVLEMVFTESAFCKYVCPLGTFNFVYSTVSPLQITARNRDICATCVGKECVNGSYNEQPMILIDQIGVNGQPDKTHTNGPDGVLGCGTLLFVPQIKSNMECTFCLDCVRACPHENVALKVRAPSAELTSSESLPKRWDVSLLLICLAFMGVTNAFGMVPPVYDLLQNLAQTLGLTQIGWSDSAIEGVVLFILFSITSLILPITLTFVAASLSNQFGKKRTSLRETAAAFAPAFVPIGLGIWIAHYGFHFLTGIFSIVPVFQQFLIDHGITLLGVEPNWAFGGVVDTDVIGIIQLVALMSGFLFSMLLVQRTSQRLYRRQAVPGMLSWSLLILMLMMISVWIFSLPMEMRGTIMFN